MNNFNHRLNQFFPDAGRPALLLDASAGLSLGTLPGLENFSEGVRPLLAGLDGIVCSPGQLRRLEPRSRLDAPTLVRMDWTNTLRPRSFVIPTETASQVVILEPRDCLELGASGMVFSFLLGYEEIIEAACLRTTVQLQLAGKDLGLPLFVEVRPTGPRISLEGKAVELGASMALESGADRIIVPYPGSESLKSIARMVAQWLLKPTSVETCIREWEEALDLGAAGLWLDHKWLGASIPLQQISTLVHQVQETGREVRNG